MASAVCSRKKALLPLQGGLHHERGICELAGRRGEKTTTVFVAGSMGRTGKRVVEKLLAKGFGVVAGTTDVSSARGSLPQDPNLQLVSLS